MGSNPEIYPFQPTSLAWNCWVTELSCWVAFTQHMDQYWGSTYIIGYTSIVSRVPWTGIFERHCWTGFILGHYDTSVCVIVDHTIVVVPVDQNSKENWNTWLPKISHFILSSFKSWRKVALNQYFLGFKVLSLLEACFDLILGSTLFMWNEEPKIKSKQASKRDRTLSCVFANC